jgi:ankyrin repeat protein
VAAFSVFQTSLFTKYIGKGHNSMRKYLLIIIGAAILFSGCATKQPEVPKATDRMSPEANAKALNLEIRSGNTQKALRLIDAGVDFYGGAIDGFYFRPLEHAVIKGNIDVAKALLDAGDDVNFIFRTPLIITAVRNRDDEMVKLLVSYKADPFVKGPRGYSALDIIRAQHTFYYLIEMFKHLEERQKYRMLRYAIDTGYDRLANYMIPEHIEVDLSDDDGVTALMYAVEAEDLANTKRLLSAGACVDCTDKNGLSAKQRAENGKSPEMAALFENRSDNASSLALVEAASVGDLQKVKALVSQGFPLDTVNQYGSNALIVATSSNHAVIVEYLIKQGANIEEVTSFGMTPLMVAAGDGAFDSVKVLLAHGAQIDKAAGEYAFFPLYLAVNSGEEAIARYLIDQGANLGQVELLHGYTPLIRALEKNMEALAKLLIERGADPHVVDFHGRTALLIAKRNGFEEVVTMLEARGAE